MNIFDFRESLTRDYAEYVRSFIRISSEDIRTKVDEALEQQYLWPEPLVQLNPSFEPGEYVDDLVKAGALHASSGKVSRRDKDRDGNVIRRWEQEWLLGLRKTAKSTDSRTRYCQPIASCGRERQASIDHVGIAKCPTGIAVYFNLYQPRVGFRAATVPWRHRRGALHNYAVAVSAPV